MTPNLIAKWMHGKLENEGCLYQDDVVDQLVRTKSDDLLRENADGNLVLSRPVLTAFRKINEHDVVWVRPDKYWRFRVAEDEPGRTARG